ncbi:haloacid dehalogenase-like hydrolase domain-containing 5 [Gigantopelta aegis]|uniref:haloacid dehalogenase-like hydrolase domain-containing 5 n=1 Tax=Gigantopelta aegis TaxID=1735272 RepID=UPI001B88B06C|nr:haloacid dehalogenase-like hydrolase domain-containing 5 [Gigantopelta aegis]
MMACRYVLKSGFHLEMYAKVSPNIGLTTIGKLILHSRQFHSQRCALSKFGFLFDIDGVIVRGKRLLPSAKEAFVALTDRHGNFRVPCLFVTNAGNTLRQKKAQQLSDWLGIQVSQDQVVMSHSPVKMFTQFHEKHVLVSGQGPIHEIAKCLGFRHVTTVEQLRQVYTNLDMVDHTRRKAAPCAFEKYFPRIEAVILFGEPVRWETNLQLIIDVLMTDGKPMSPPKQTIHPHLPIIACNMDLLWMAEAPLPRFGHGCFLNCLESLYLKITGYELKYTALIGKPSEITYHHADHMLRQQAKQMGINGIKTIYCIGDNPETDIYGANLYNRYLQKRARSHKKLMSSNSVPMQAMAQASGQQITDVTTETDASDDCDEDDIGSTMIDSDENFAEKCESILVCTGVYCTDRDFVTFGGKKSSNHNHRDFVIDPELKKPKHVSLNILEALKMVFEKEGFH